MSHSYLVASAGPFQFGKLWIQHVLGLEKDTLHIITGMLAFVIAMLVFRKKPWHWLPVTTAIAAALTGEILDVYEVHELLLVAWSQIQWDASIHDIMLTTMLPIAIFLISYSLRPFSTTGSGREKSPS